MNTDKAINYHLNEADRFIKEARALNKTIDALLDISKNTEVKARLNLAIARLLINSRNRNA